MAPLPNSANPWVGVNYLPDNARMEVPPAFFLQRIWDQDAMLVVMPSRHVPFAYVIARRKQFGIGLTSKALLDSIDQPDTKMCLLHGCVPVCLMYKTGPVWNADTIIATLQARDLWAHGGADKVADMLDAQDEQERTNKLKAVRDDLYNRSGDGWRSYQARTKQTTNSPYGQTRELKPRRKAADLKQPPSTSGSTAGSGPLVTLS